MSALAINFIQAKTLRFARKFGMKYKAYMRALSVQREPKLLMPYSSIESNGLHYPSSFDKGFSEPSPCYFAGCVPNMPCKVEAYEKYCAEQYEPTNLDDLVY